LWHNTHAGPHRRTRVNGGSVNLDLSGIACQNPSNPRERGGLPGAVRSKQTVDFARLDGKANAIDRHPLAKAFP